MNTLTHSVLCYMVLFKTQSPILATEISDEITTITGQDIRYPSYRKVPSFVVELAIICDKDFSALFDNDKDQIINYWNHQIWDMQVQFQTLPSTNITFIITTIMVINNIEDQPFLEEFRSDLNLQNIFKGFSNWTYQNQNRLSADVAILVTGTYGKDQTAYKPKSVCNVNSESEEFTSVLVLRSRKPRKWHNRWELNTAMAQILGADWDNNTDCKESPKLMGISLNESYWDFLEEFKLDKSAMSKFYFSNCSDSGIREFLSSMNATCLTVFKGKSTTSINGVELPLTKLEQCKIEVNKDAIENENDTDKCLEINCYSPKVHLFHKKKQLEWMQKNKLQLRGYVFPLTNSPCGNSKVCFRGQCLNQGVILKNIETQTCLLASYKFIPKNIVALLDCPKKLKKFDEFRMLEDAKGGVYFATSDPISERKCLSVHLNEMRLQLRECPDSQANPQYFLWDVIPVRNAEDEYLICNRRNKTCAVADQKSGLMVLDILNEFNTAQQWTIQKDTEANIKELENRPKLERAIQFYGLDFKIEIALICDFECAKIFRNDEKKFRNFWSGMLSTTYPKFETIPNINIAFNISSVLMLNTSGSTDIGAQSKRTSFAVICQEYLKLIQKYFVSLPKFDVLLFITGTKGDDFRFLVLSSTTCKLNHVRGAFSSTIMFRMGQSNVEWCESEVSQAFASMLLSSKQTVTLSEQIQSSNCKDRLYFYSESESRNITNFLTSKQASGLLVSAGIGQSNVQPSAPSFQEQCQILTNDMTAYVKLNESTCEAAKCFKNISSFEIVIGNINPMTYTPCENDKICFGNRCIQKGHQIQNVETGRCLRGKDYLSIDDPTQLSKCSQASTPLNQMIFLASSESDFMKTMFINSNDNEIEEKCLSVQREVVQFSKCPDKISTPFAWTRYYNRENDDFLISHKIGGKCLKVESDQSLVLAGGCSFSKPAFLWRMHLPGSDIDSRMVDKDGQVDKESTTESNALIYVWVIIALLVLLLTIVAAWNGRILYKRRNESNVNRISQENFYKGDVDNINNDLDVSDQASKLPFDRKWEFSINRLKLGKELGSGAFGQVLMSVAKGIKGNEKETTVAVKTLQQSADASHLDALKHELKILSHLGNHINLVNLLGACTEFIAKNKLWVILEFCKYGSLRSFLLRHRENFINMNVADFKKTSYAKSEIDNSASSIDNVFSEIEINEETELIEDDYKGDYQSLDVQAIRTIDLICYSFQIAKGMDYLTSRRVLHGDLAARNILLASDGIIKICDFGLSRELRKNYDYNYKKEIKGVPLPVKWMALESIELGLFSSESDCWSFGVVLWEIFTLGKLPYPGISIDINFTKRLREGYRLEKPSYAPSRIYDIMLKCWRIDKSSRPKFSELATTLRNMLGTNMNEFYAELNSEYERMDLVQEEEQRMSTTGFLSHVTNPNYGSGFKKRNSSATSSDGYLIALQSMSSSSSSCNYRNVNTTTDLED